MKTNLKKALATGLIGLTAFGATAVVPAVAEAQEIEAPSAEEREARRAERSEARAQRIADIAEILGTDAESLQTARQSGQSLADIAAANGVSVDVVIDFLVTSKTEHIQEHVANGDITQEKADEIIANLSERVTERVSAIPGEGTDGERSGRRGRGGFGHRGLGGAQAEG